MLVTAVAEACPLALQEAVQEARTLKDVFETVRPLAFHSECFVSLARCTSTQQQLVIKSYLTRGMSDREKQQVATEMRIHSRLTHPNIAGFLLAFEDSQHCYLAIEFAEGGDLQSLLEAGPLSEAKARDFLVIPLLQALSEMHVQGVIHRDIKPANVLVQDNSVRLADFGLAMYASHPVNPPLDGLVSHRSISKRSRANSLGKPQPHHSVRISSVVSTDAAAGQQGGSHGASGSGTDSRDDSCGSAASDSEGEDCASNDAGTPRAAIRNHSLCSSSVLGLGLGRGGSSCTDIGSLADNVRSGVSYSNTGSIGKSRLDTGVYCSTATAAHASAGGTPLYAAPEVLKAMFHDPRDVGDVISHENDVWALGIMALEAIAGAHPFSPDHSPNENMMYTIAHHSKLVLPAGLSEEAADWLSQALQRSPQDRPTAEALLQHPWISKEYSAEEEGPGALRCFSAVSFASVLSDVPESWEY